MKNQNIKTGQIRFVNFKGEFALQGGVRPAIIIQNEIGCIHSPRVWVIPLTTRVEKAKHLPMHILIPKSGYNGLRENSVALVEQASFVLKSDVGDIVGHLEDDYRYRCGEAWINNCNGMFPPKIINIASGNFVA